MGMKFFLKILYCYSLLIVSCAQKKILSEDVKKLIPYKGREVLIFQSDKGRLDTLFLKGLKRYYRFTGAQNVFSDSIEHIFISYKTIGTKSDIQKPTIGTILDIFKSPQGITRIGFGLKLDSLMFYGLRYYDLNVLDSMTLMNIVVANKNYNDVLVIYPDQDNEKYSDEPDYIKCLFWSKSNGLIRFDSDEQIWELKRS